VSLFGCIFTVIVHFALNDGNGTHLTRAKQGFLFVLYLLFLQIALKSRVVSITSIFLIDLKLVSRDRIMGLLKKVD
jgi:hypothetical protein